MSVGVTLCKERVGQGIVFCLGVPAFQNGSAGEKELYVAFQVKGAGPVSPGQQGNFAAALLGGAVDCRLNCFPRADE